MADFFEGKVAIVTGGSQGIGAATVRALAARGAKVVINYVSSADLAEALQDEIGEHAIAVQADLGAGEAEKLAKAALDKWGRIDGLVNNAGKTAFANHEDLDALSAEDFLDIYRLNVVGAYEMIRAVAPTMQEQGSGAIVNITSVAAHYGIGSSVAYAASKGALLTMTYSLARALAPEIRVNAISPGYVGTGWFTNRLGEEAKLAIDKHFEETTPLRRAGTAEDIADMIVPLLDEASRHMTGQAIVVDAGSHLDVGSSRRKGKEL
ncbi:MAG: SDR family NAD(P)-dependent oxidoreductase [Parasphingopyxis sp.]|uniref:SDR family NAD(P)-dependent oxidoreductase n=1 Tax=Parasphingopyxis sp. TaxID=1920299 RepID=UPI003F9F996E